MIRTGQDLDKYNVDQLVKIAVYNRLFGNDYYVSKKEIKQALWTCVLTGDILLIPDHW